MGERNGQNHQSVKARNDMSEEPSGRAHLKGSRPLPVWQVARAAGSAAAAEQCLGNCVAIMMGRPMLCLYTRADRARTHKLN